jgi:hypothetical protein
VVHTEAPTATEPDTKAVRCSCPDSPWCTGPTGPYWLSCAHACRFCHPPQRRRRDTASGPVVAANPSSAEG